MEMLPYKDDNDEPTNAKPAQLLNGPRAMEEGLDSNTSRYKPSWWKWQMPRRVRSSQCFDASEEQLAENDEEANRLLNGRVLHDNSHSRSLCGRMTILCTLAIILVVNAATFIYIWHRSNSNPLKDWGKPGTTSEGLSWYPTDFLRDIIPIPCHSHNDYWRKVPLFTGLYNGCVSTEADVWSIDGELFVGHNTASLTSNRTFQSLYIYPLVKILERQNPVTEFYNGTKHGVFDTDPEQSLTLLVDVKTNGARTWPLVLKHLEPLRQRGWLSYVENDVLVPGPITVVGTGWTGFEVLTANKTYRDAFFDAPLQSMWEDEESEGNTLKSLRTFPSKIDGGQGSSDNSVMEKYNSLNSYYASTSFTEVVGRVWWGKLSTEQMQLLRGFIRGAHRRGLKARFWEQPAWPISLRNYIWDVFVQEGVDILNVDDLEAVRIGRW